VLKVKALRTTMIKNQNGAHLTRGRAPEPKNNSKISTTHIITQSVDNKQSLLNLHICPHCGDKLRLNVVRAGIRKYLRCGSCDGALRVCPDARELLERPGLSQEQIDFLRRVEAMPWFSSCIAVLLLEIEEATA
jgi:hypothetical protein